MTQVIIPRKNAEGKKHRPRVALEFNEPTRTKQEFLEECDINTVMGRAKAIQRMQDPTLINTNYGDGTGYDFHEAMNFITKVQQDFEQYPVEIRNRFNNDPGALLDFVHNPENKEEMRKLGMLKEPKPEMVENAKPGEKTEGKPPETPPESKAEPQGDKKGDKEGVT